MKILPYVGCASPLRLIYCRYAVLLEFERTIRNTEAEREYTDKQAARHSIDKPIQKLELSLHGV